MDQYEQVMNQVEKLRYTPADVRSLFEELGFQVPLDPDDKRLKLKNHKGQPVHPKDVWYNDRIIIAIANSPAVDTFNESIRPEALREALTHFITPLDEGGAGGELSWAHGQWFPAGKVLGVSDILSKHGLYPVAIGFRSDSPMSDEVWTEVEKLGFDMGFSIGMDPFSVEREYTGYLANVTRMMIDELATTPIPANDASRVYGWPSTRKGIEDFIHTLTESLIEKGYSDDLACRLAMESRMVIGDQAHRMNLATKGGIIRGMSLKGATLYKKDDNLIHELIVTGLKDQMPGLELHLAKLRNSGMSENSALQTVYQDLEALILADNPKKETGPKTDKSMEEQEILQSPEVENRVAALEEQMAQIAEKVQAIFETVMGQEIPGAGAPPEEMAGKEAKSAKTAKTAAPPKKAAEPPAPADPPEQDTVQDEAQGQEEEPDKAEGDQKPCGTKKPPRREDLEAMSKEEIIQYLAEAQGGQVKEAEDPRKPKSLSEAGISSRTEDGAEPTREEVSQAIDEVGLEAVLEEADKSKKM